MRPIHLEMTGFGPFRKKTEIDLSDIELVALVGRTGSGKSTIIDAMTFALFGGISRYGKNKLFPAINQMSNEALVVLTFQLGGRIYKVLRKLVRTSNKGASTKEARLGFDDGSELIKVDEIDSEITKLLGLDFAQFNKAVFLPQGKFAEFLHETPINRQRILRGILDLGVYEKVRNLSTARASSTDTEIKILESQLREVDHFSQELEGELAGKVEKLERLRVDVKNELREIERQNEVVRELYKKSLDFNRQLEVIRGIEKPEGVDTLSDLILVAEEQFSKAENDISKLNSAFQNAETALENLTTQEQLNPVIENHENLQMVEIGLVEKRNELKLASEQFGQAEVDWTRADLAKKDLSKRYELLLTKSRVSAFAKDLVVGEPCPLCLSKVNSIPAHDHSHELEEASKQKEAATQVAEQAFRSKATIESKLEKLTQEVSEMESRELALRRELEGSVSLAVAKEKLEAYQSGLTKVNELARALRIGQQEVDKTRKVWSELKDKAAAERSVFEDARDALSRVNLDPPKGSHTSLVDNWTTLIEWCDRTKLSIEKDLNKNEQVLHELRNLIASSENDLLGRLEQHEVSYKGAFNLLEVNSALERTLANTVSELALVRTGLKRKESAAIQLKEQNDQYLIYKTLSNYLESRNFEAWLMQEVLTELAEGATQHLLTLSSGAYSLELRDKHFVVRDHHNADEIRVAESLSGGETFLASLALALSLSDSIAGMAEKGAAKLESLFLDEGFGTLDSETLDVVASSIEELGSEGRMIGIVTHVDEIAQRMPVRIKVTKGPETSVVERLES